MSLPFNTPRLLRWSLALALIHAGASSLVAAHLRAPSGSVATRAHVAREGIEVDECPREFEAWRFEGRTRDAVVELARLADVDVSQRVRLRALARCDARGCTVMPDAALTASLSREARTALYRELSRHAVNRLHYFAARRPAALGPWSAMAGLSPRVRALLDAGTWIDDAGRYAYSDLAWLCTSLDTDAERAEALAALRTR